MAVSIAAVQQDVYPPRIRITVSGMTLTDSVRVVRVVSGVETLVRGGYVDSVTDPALVLYDAEFPFGLPVTYKAIINDSTTYSDGPTTHQLPNPDLDALSDAISGASAEVLTVAQPEWSYEVEASVFKVGGRNVVVSGDVGGYETEIEFYTEAASSGENFKNLLKGATQNILQLRDSLGNSAYFSVLSFRERRYSNDRTDGRRYFVLSVVQVDPWASALKARGFTLQDIADYYGVSGDLQDIANDYSTLLAIAEGDFS